MKVPTARPQKYALAESYYPLRIWKTCPSLTTLQLSCTKIKPTKMAFVEPPIHWNDYEDIALKLYERFGDDFTESKIYRIRFTELLEWVLAIDGFVGTREQSNEGHLEMIQSSWVYEWRDGQK